MRRRSLVVIVLAGSLAAAAIAFFWPRARGPARPLVYNVAGLLGEDDLRLIRDLVGARGEKFPISIAVVNAEKAQVTVGDGGFEAGSGRVYKVHRGKEGWEVDKVEEWKNEL